MSVLIKGMNMPKNCNTCPMLEGDVFNGLCHAASRCLDDDEYWKWYLYPEGDVDDSRPLNCPLVEVKTPHGRLVDFGDIKYKGYTEAEINDLFPTVIEEEEHE